MEKLRSMSRVLFALQNDLLGVHYGAARGALKNGGEARAGETDHENCR
jgi:hypothetical protein